MKILVLGASGMLGNAMLRVLSREDGWEVFGTLRSSYAMSFFPEAIAARLIVDCDVEDHDSVMSVFARVKPDVVINCVGLVKQLADADDPLVAIPINSLLPHRLAKLCQLAGARLIHISTDCVFQGTRGDYHESDSSDAVDLYGRSKLLGEVDYPHAVTLRTSIIGQELNSTHGLIEWFLSQEGQCRGFTRAIFSGFPTVVLAGIIRDFIIPNSKLHGLYHVAAKPISKYDLLHIVANIYGKKIEIIADDKLSIDRSLNADRFAKETGYRALGWEALVQEMHDSWVSDFKK